MSEISFVLSDGGNRMDDDLFSFFLVIGAVVLGIIAVLWLLFQIFIVFWFITYPVLAVSGGGVLWWRVSGQFSYERKRAEARLWCRHRWIELKTYLKIR